MSKKHIIVLVIALLLMLIVVIAMLLLKENDNSTYININEFTDEYVKENQVNMKVYYLPWEAESFSPITEETLISASSQTIVTAVPFPYTWWRYAAGLRPLLQNLQYSKEDTKHLTFRYSCVFYCGKKKILQLSLAPSVPVALVINGKRYEPTQELVKFLIQFLPHEEYKVVHENLEKTDFFSLEKKDDSDKSSTPKKN